MNRTLLSSLVALGLFSVSCSDAATTAPMASTSLNAAVAAHRGPYSGHGNSNSTYAGLVRCENHPTYTGTADIGASGGQIIVGSSRVIFPAGALTKKTRITARIPAGNHLTMTFEFSPHGTTFKKPAGLVFNAASCDIPSYLSPDIVYLGDNGEILEYIQSFYSNYWHLVAAPIWHFSVYAVAF